MSRIFFYGLFMDVELLREMGFHPVPIGPAELGGYALHIGDKATLLPRRGAKSYGIVMDLSDEEATALYASPGVSDYRPEEVAVTLLADGSVRPALCYNLPEIDLAAAPNVEYAEKLSALVRALGFPSRYAREIARWGDSS